MAPATTKSKSGKATTPAPLPPVPTTPSTQQPTLYARAVRIALYAVIVRTYWSPQETLRVLGVRDVELLAHVVRFLLTLLTYSFAAAYVSWFYYLGAAIFAQSTCWVLYISKDRYLPLGLDEATEKAYLEIGASLCYAVLAWIICFGGAAEERQQLRNRLVTFYTKHNPSKIAEVDELLKKYDGNEELLFARLHRKYNALSGGVGADAPPGSKRALARDFDESAFLYEQSEDDEDVDAATASEQAEAAADDGADDADDEQAQDADNEESEGANDRSTGGASSGDSENDEGYQVVKAPLSPRSVRKLSISTDGGELPGTPPGRAVTSTSSTRIQAALQDARRAQEERVAQRIAQLMARVSPQ